MKKYRINFEIDSKNVEKFQKFKYNANITYQCLICGKIKNLTNMVSNQGQRMICIQCAKKNYGDYLTAIDKFCKNRGK